MLMFFTTIAAFTPTQQAILLTSTRQQHYDDCYSSIPPDAAHPPMAKQRERVAKARHVRSTVKQRIFFF